jgi:hypothetical protein
MGGEIIVHEAVARGQRLVAGREKLHSFCDGDGKTE